jgi:uncharacterized membrane protein YbhN (UPF0104 family)
MYTFGPSWGASLLSSTHRRLPAHPAEAFASFVFAQETATVLVAFGGLGSFEASAVVMLAFFRGPVEVSLTATLLLRGFTYWLPMAPGLWLSRRELKGRRRERS